MAPPIARGLFLCIVQIMDITESNVGEIAVELLDIAEQMIEGGEDFCDVQGAFVAVAIRLNQLRDEADEDARNMILRSMK